MQGTAGLSHASGTPTADLCRPSRSRLFRAAAGSRSTQLTVNYLLAGMSESYFHQKKRTTKKTQTKPKQQENAKML